MYQRFENRAEGGRALAAKLLRFKNHKDAIVLALPGGGVPVAFEIAKALDLPMDAFIVRKLRAPFREELAFGAIASGGITILNEAIIDTFRIPSTLISKVCERENAELERRGALYRANNAAPSLRDKTVIIVDDSIATGETMRAAVAAVRHVKPKQIIVAVPVGSLDACKYVKQKASDVCICVKTPEPFNGVGMWYRDFKQVNDKDVCSLLSKANTRVSGDLFKTKHAALRN